MPVDEIVGITPRHKRVGLMTHPPNVRRADARGISSNSLFWQVETQLLAFENGVISSLLPLSRHVSSASF